MDVFQKEMMQETVLLRLEKLGQLNAATKLLALKERHLFLVPGAGQDNRRC